MLLHQCVEVGSLNAHLRCRMGDVAVAGFKRFEDKGFLKLPVTNVNKVLFDGLEFFEGREDELLQLLGRDGVGGIGVLAAVQWTIRTG